MKTTDEKQQPEETTYLYNESASKLVLKALTPEVQSRLLKMTHEELDAGARVEDILWLRILGKNFDTDRSGPDVALAATRQKMIETAVEQDPDMPAVIRAIPPPPAGLLTILCRRADAPPLERNICVYWDLTRGLRLADFHARVGVGPAPVLPEDRPDPLQLARLVRSQLPKRKAR